MQTQQEIRRKFEKDFVVIYKGRYWGLNFDKKEIQEITFEEAYGCSFFDWGSNICIASDYLKQRYDEARGEDGCGWVGKIVQMAWKNHPDYDELFNIKRRKQKCKHNKKNTLT